MSTKDLAKKWKYLCVECGTKSERLPKDIRGCPVCWLKKHPRDNPEVPASPVTGPDAAYHKKMTGPSERVIGLMYSVIEARNLFRRKDDRDFGSPGSSEAVAAWQSYIEEYEKLKTAILEGENGKA